MTKDEVAKYVGEYVCVTTHDGKSYRGYLKVGVFEVKLLAMAGLATISLDPGEIKYISSGWAD